jgi:hypothetical protein
MGYQQGFQSGPQEAKKSGAPTGESDPDTDHVTRSGELTPVPFGGGFPRSVEEYWKWSLPPGA